MDLSMDRSTQDVFDSENSGIGTKRRTPLDRGSRKRHRLKKTPTVLETQENGADNGIYYGEDGRESSLSPSETHSDSTARNTPVEGVIVSGKQFQDGVNWSSTASSATEMVDHLKEEERHPLISQIKTISTMGSMERGLKSPSASVSPRAPGVAVLPEDEPIIAFGLPTTQSFMLQEIVVVPRAEMPFSYAHVFSIKSETITVIVDFTPPTRKELPSCLVGKISPNIGDQTINEQKKTIHWWTSNLLRHAQKLQTQCSPPHNGKDVLVHRAGEMKLTLQVMEHLHRRVEKLGTTTDKSWQCKEKEPLEQGRQSTNTGWVLPPKRQMVLPNASTADMTLMKPVDQQAQLESQKVKMLIKTASDPFQEMISVVAEMQLRISQLESQVAKHQSHITTLEEAVRLLMDQAITR